VSVPLIVIGSWVSQWRNWPRDTADKPRQPYDKNG